MVEEFNVVPKGYKENPDLMPIPPSQRHYGTRTFSFMMFSLSANIPLFFLGPMGKSLGLDIIQTGVGAFLGNLFAIVLAWLIGVAGVKYGITYPVQLRESFGFKGAHVPLVLRGISGTVWFGIEIYAGSLALMMILLMALGVPSDELVMTAIRWIPIACALYVLSFILVMRHGLKGIGAVADWAGPILLLYFIWLVLFLATREEFSPKIPEIFESSAGYFSASFGIYLAAQTNWWATIALNISDLSRGIKIGEPRALPIGLLTGIVGGMTLGSVLGHAAVTMTGVVLPQEIILKFAPGVIAILLGLFFSFLAPWTTDLTANSPPLIDLIMVEGKLSWKTSTILAGIIAFFIAPWWAVGSGPDFVNYITAWASNYGILLGPLAGIMIANFWVTRKGRYDLQRLYTYGPEGPWYANGWSKAAFASLVLTWVLCYIIAYPTGQIAYLAGVPFPGGVITYPAVVISFILYAFLAKAFGEDKVALFETASGAEPLA
jgi:NCS1 family nucleobase:cation symporter-1